MASSEKIDQSLPASANSAVMSALRYSLLLFLLSLWKCRDFLRQLMGEGEGLALSVSFYCYKLGRICLFQIPALGEENTSKMDACGAQKKV